MSKLFTSLTIRNITLRNRIAISPMCQYSCEDGFPTDWHFVHLGSRAVGGAGLVIQEATAVSPEGRISPGDAGLYSDAHIEKWKPIVSFIRQQGAVAGIQLAHAGRKASCHVPWEGGKQIAADSGGWQTVAPSAIPFADTDMPPAAMNIDAIEKVAKDFKAAAERALSAGYEVIELHAAHGYLLHEFLSPLSNKRTDDYGGSFENRIRLLLDVTRSVRSVWPDELPLFVRISSTDWSPGGWDEHESAKLAAILKDYGVDLIDCSSGGILPHIRIPVAPGYQTIFAGQIKKSANILTGAVGLITAAEQAEAILQDELADIILIARASLRDPYFPMHAAKIVGDDIKFPAQYERAK